MHLGNLIDEIGGFGWYQRWLIPMIASGKVIIAPSMMIMAFAGAEPDWWCQTDDVEHPEILNGSFRNCDWNSSCNRQFAPGMVTIVSRWNLVCDKAWVSNTIISIQMAGVLVGAAVTGYLSDTYGRKRVLFASVAINIAGNLIAAFSVSWIMFTVLRVILGMSVGMNLSVNFLYQVEFVGSKYRGLVASLPSWNLGVVLYAVLVWLIRDWKWTHVACAGLAAPFLLGWFIIPESLRWLTVKGRLDEARHVIRKMAKFNKKPVPDTTILELIAEEERAEGEKAKNYNYKHLFSTRSLTRKTLVTCFIWFAVSVVYYGISFGVKNLSGDLYLNTLLMGLLELPMFFCVFLISYLFGRRTGCAVLFSLSLVTCCGVAVSARVAPPELKAHLENGFAISAKFFCLCGWLFSQALSTEQFPTVIRNLAFAAQNTTARVGGIIAAQLLSMGSKDDLMPPFVAMAVLMGASVIACFMLDETKRVALEDTMIKELKVRVNIDEVQQVLLTDDKKDPTNNHTPVVTDMPETEKAATPRETETSINAKD